MAIFVGSGLLDLKAVMQKWDVLHPSEKSGPLETIENPYKKGLLNRTDLLKRRSLLTTIRATKMGKT